MITNGNGVIQLKQNNTTPATISPTASPITPAAPQQQPQEQTNPSPPTAAILTSETLATTTATTKSDMNEPVAANDEVSKLTNETEDHKVSI